MTTILPTTPASLRPAWRGMIAAVALAVTLSACASTGGVTGTAPPQRRIKGVPTVRQPARTPQRDAQVQMVPGLENVIGANRGQLLGLFGQPRLDVWEGDARKLQFAGTACVLDIYLYPSATSKEPRATYVESRRSSDGRDVDRAACVAALRSAR